MQRENAKVDFPGPKNTAQVKPAKKCLVPSVGTLGTGRMGVLVDILLLLDPIPLPGLMQPLRHRHRTSIHHPPTQDIHLTSGQLRWLHTPVQITPRPPAPQTHICHVPRHHSVDLLPILPHRYTLVATLWKDSPSRLVRGQPPLFLVQARPVLRGILRDIHNNLPLRPGCPRGLFQESTDNLRRQRDFPVL